MRNLIIIASLIACIFIIANWVNALEEIEVGHQSPTTGFWVGDSPESAAEKRSQVNSTYGLWVALIIGVSGGFYYIANEKDKKTKELKAWHESEGKKEIESLLNENAVNVHKSIKVRVVKLREKNPEWGLNKLVEQLNKEGYVGLDKNTVKRILDQTDGHSILDTEEKPQLSEVGKEIAELKAKLKKLEEIAEKGQVRKKPSQKEIVECPYCLEDIYAGAIKCKHCNTHLNL